MNIAYCIRCEKDVAVEDGTVKGHTILVAGESGQDVEFCEGPFFVTPNSLLVPDVDDIATDLLFTDYDRFMELLEEPSPEELAQMDSNAQDLLNDILGDRE